MPKHKLKRKVRAEALCLRPDKRLCARFNALSLAEFPTAQPGEMGVIVMDNCAEEHIM